MINKVFLTKSVSRVLERGARNVQKDKLESFFERYDFEITNLETNLAVLKIIIENKAETEKYFEFAPSFMAISWYNAWFTAVVLLCSMLKTNSEGSIFGLLNFVESNDQALFTKEWYEADAPFEGEYVEEELSWKKITLQSPSEVLSQSRTMLADNEDKIKAIFTVRDKVYAHFDIISINGEQRTVLLEQINFGLLQSLTKLVAEVINLLHLIYDRTTHIYEPIGSDDLLNFYKPLCYYEAHIEQAVLEELQQR